MHGLMVLSSRAQTEQRILISATILCMRPRANWALQLVLVDSADNVADLPTKPLERMLAWRLESAVWASKCDSMLTLRRSSLVS